MLDLVIRGGTIVDGSGGASFTGDVGMQDGRIVAIGRVDGRGRRELDARGLLVTPGWVDVHTHYDGQATWDSLISPSCWHGVTTAVMGNCGVGFAPVKPGTHDYLIKLMEGVEDIPGSVLWEGVQWAWESFPEYLDALASKPRAIDIAAQVPHAALRFYVMGERGADHTEAPTAAEIDAMGVLARDAVRAGDVIELGSVKLRFVAPGEPYEYASPGRQVGVTMRSTPRPARLAADSEPRPRC